VDIGLRSPIYQIGTHLNTKTPMPDLDDPLRDATVLIKEYGEDAPIYAFLHAEDLREQGDKEGEELWACVLEVLGDLLSEELPEGTTVH
jgi:hypothetical protein